MLLFPNTLTIENKKGTKQKSNLSKILFFFSGIRFQGKIILGQSGKRWNVGGQKGDWEEKSDRGT